MFHLRLAIIFSIFHLSIKYIFSCTFDTIHFAQLFLLRYDFIQLKLIIYSSFYLNIETIFLPQQMDISEREERQIFDYEIDLNSGCARHNIRFHSSFVWNANEIEIDRVKASLFSISRPVRSETTEKLWQNDLMTMNMRILSTQRVNSRVSQSDVDWTTTNNGAQQVNDERLFCVDCHIVWVYESVHEIDQQ